MCVSCKCVCFHSIFVLFPLPRPFKAWYMYLTDIIYVFCLALELYGTGKKVYGGGGGGGLAGAEREGSGSGGF